MRHETFPAGRSRIADMPALVLPAAYEPRRAVFEAIDADARRLVEAMIVELEDGEPGVDVVGMLWQRVARYSRNGLTWLAETNRDLALALQSDPRLAVVTSMHAGAETAVTTALAEGATVFDRRMAIDQYGALLRAGLARRAAA